MRVTVNAISAKLGGAVTYLQNVLPEMQRQVNGSHDHQMVVWRGAVATGDQWWPAGIEYREDPLTSGSAHVTANPLRRLYFDQVQLPKSLHLDRTDVLFSSANYGPLRCPCRQVLLVRNSAYFDELYLSRIRSAKVRAYQMFQRWMTLRCMKAADIVFFPTRAMMDLVAAYTGGVRANWFAAHYGTRHDQFYPAPEPRELSASPVNLLHVSLYCDQKNLGTLLRAVQDLQRSEQGRYHLQLTAGFEHGELIDNPATPDFRADQQLYYELKNVGAAEDLKWRRHGTLPELYRSADIFVFPSYTESFGHPLVEAMASGLPVVAADVPVNRELCGDAAIYCPPFEAQAWSAAIRQVAEDDGLRLRLRDAAIRRASDFTWQHHVSELMKAFTKRSA